MSEREGFRNGRGLETTDAFLKFVFIVSICVVYFIGGVSE